MNKLSRRGLARIISFATALVVILSAGWWTAYRQNRDVSTKLEYSYMRAVEDLTVYMEDLHTNLTKSLYSGTSSQLTKLSTKIYQQAGFAKSTLAQIPTSNVNLSNTYKFLSQLGNYSLALAQKTANNQPLTDQDRTMMTQLNNYCVNMKEQLYLLQDELRTGAVDFAELQNIADLVEGDQVREVSGFQGFEDSLAEFPTMIYDGPFSDHLLSKDPLMTQSLSSVPREQARDLAALSANLSVDQLKDDTDEEGKMPSYTFRSDTVNASVTKNGGLLCYMLNSRSVGETKVDISTAQENALAYLKKLGIESLSQTYYEVTNNVLLINYAHQDNDICCYTDLIKVSVALDNGDIVGYDARGYIINHHQRSYPQPQVSVEEAQQSLSPLLTVQKSKLALIPSEGGDEVLCYEFSCTSSDDQNILVYINVETGEEQQILILIVNENGTLTI